MKTSARYMDELPRETAVLKVLVHYLSNSHHTPVF